MISLGLMTSASLIAAVDSAVVRSTSGSRLFDRSRLRALPTGAFCMQCWMLVGHQDRVAAHQCHSLLR